MTPEPEQQHPIHVEREGAEPRAAVRRGQRAPGLAAVVGTVRDPRLRRDEQPPGPGRHELVQVKIVLADGAGAPGAAAVVGAQDHRVVAHRPASAWIVHVHHGEQGPGGHPRLLPARAAVGGDQDVAALADHHQPRTGQRPVEQQGLDGERGLDGPFSACAVRYEENRQGDESES